MTNVLLITVDQWRADCLSVAGHPVVRTPNLDRLAADGIRFTRHFAQTAPCGPSRASLLTGTYLHNHRSVGNGTPLDARFTNVALEFRGAGYDPVLFGYTDTTVDPRTVTDPDDPRLSTYEGVMDGFRPVVHLPEHARPWAARLRARGLDLGDGYPEVFAQQDLPEAAGRGSTWAPARYPAELSEAAFLTEAVIDHVAGSTGEPWFVHLTYLQPHAPFVAPAPYHDLYSPDDVPPPVRHPDADSEGAVHPFIAAVLMSGLANAPRTELEQRQWQATYYGMMSEVDAQIGRLVDALTRSGTIEDTIIVLTSDHGEQLGDHWLREKLAFFDSSYHIPLIFRLPDGVGAGTTVDRFTENVDIMPTLLDLCGLEPPVQCDGHSLRPFLEGATPLTWRDAAHWEWDFRDPTSDALERSAGLTMDECALAVLRDEHGKYVHFGGFPPIFYDLETDPGELHDVAADPLYRERVLNYAQRLLTWRLTTDDRTLTGYLATPDGMVHRRD